MAYPPITRTTQRGRANDGFRPRSTDVRPQGRTFPRRRRRVSPVWLAVLLFFAVLALLCYYRRIPVYVPAAYLAMSLLTYLWYGADKRSAERGEWRTSEALLHWLEIAGGWPGGLAAQWQLRHKNRKQEYQAVFWLIVIAHVGSLGWLAWSGSLPAGRISLPARPSFSAFKTREPAKSYPDKIVIEVLPPKKKRIR